MVHRFEFASVEDQLALQALDVVKRHAVLEIHPSAIKTNHLFMGMPPLPEWVIEDQTGRASTGGAVKQTVIFGASVVAACVVAYQLRNDRTVQPPASLSDIELVIRDQAAAEGRLDTPPSSPPYEIYLPPTYAQGGTVPSFDDCTQDCSGHEAGYQWAEENDIQDARDCSGNSQSFIEGCEQRAQEWQQSNPEEQLEEQPHEL